LGPFLSRETTKRNVGKLTDKQRLVIISPPMEGNSPLGGVSTKQLKTRVWDEA